MSISQSWMLISFIYLGLFFGQSGPTSVKIDTNWFLRHCTDGPEDLNTSCLTDREDPISCLPVRNVENCKKASGSFSHAPSAEIASLHNRSFAIDKDKHFLCYLPEIEAEERAATLIALEVEMDKLEKHRSPYRVAKFGCVYTKGISSPEDLQRTMCCYKFPEAIVQGSSVFIATVHSIPGYFKGDRESAFYQTDSLPILDLGNYLTNFVNNSLPNVVIKTPSAHDVETVRNNEDSDQNVVLLVCVVILGSILAIIIFVAIALAVRHFLRQSKDLKKRGTLPTGVPIDDGCATTSQTSQI